MIFHNRLLFIILIISPLSSFSEDINEVRSSFYEGVMDTQKAAELDTQLSNVKDSSALFLAYKGATKALLAREGKNVLQRYVFIQESRKLISKAVEMEPNNVEIRFLRFSIQHHLPGLLGMSKELTEDKEFIVDSARRMRMPKLDEYLYKFIYRFMCDSGRCTSEELEILKKTLFKA